MASNSSRNEHPYDDRLRYWRNEQAIPARELSEALTTEWFSLPYSAETEKFRNPPLRKSKQGGLLEIQCYIPHHLREPVRMAVRILALYRHLAARVPWIDMRTKASSNNQPTLVAWVHQMYSGLRLNAYVAQKVLEGVVDKVKAITLSEGVRDRSTAAPHRNFPPSSHIPELIQFLFEQVEFGTSCPEVIDMPHPVFREGDDGRRYFPDPITLVKRKIDEGNKHALCLRGAKTCSSPDIEVADDGYDVYFAEAVVGIQKIFDSFAMQDAGQLDNIENDYPAGPGNPALDPVGPTVLLVPQTVHDSVLLDHEVLEEDEIARIGSGAAASKTKKRTQTKQGGAKLKKKPNTGKPDQHGKGKGKDPQGQVDPPSDLQSASGDTPSKENELDPSGTGPSGSGELSPSDKGNDVQQHSSNEQDAGNSEEGRKWRILAGLMETPLWFRATSSKIIHLLHSNMLSAQEHSDAEEEEIAQTLEKSMTFDGPAPKRQLYPRRPNLNLNSPTVRKNPTQTRPIPSWPSLAGALAGSSAGTRNTYLLKVLLANAKKPALQDEDSLIGAIERTAADAASFRELYKSSAAEFQDTVRYIHQTLGKETFTDLIARLHQNVILQLSTYVEKNGAVGKRAELEACEAALKDWWNVWCKLAGTQVPEEVAW